MFGYREAAGSQAPFWKLCWLWSLAVNERLFIGLFATVFAVSCCGASNSGSDAAKATSTCQGYVNAAIKLQCSTGPLAIQVVSPERLLQACGELLTLPGITLTSAELDACANAAGDAGCGQNEAELAACTFTGSLPEGSGCNDGSQCASGECSASFPDCGACVATIPEGAPCSAN
jgi:hypothetical protein